MAAAPIYCTHKELKRVFPQLDEFDNKAQVFGWESLGNNVYISHNSGLVTQLFSDGKELNPIAQAGNAAAAYYKSSLTASLDISSDSDTLPYNVLNYNAGAFSTGSETDIQAGDYIRLDDSTSMANEYAFVESVNTGTNQITIRRGAIGSTIVSWTTGNSATFEDYIRVHNKSQWYYDESLDQVLLYSTTDPNDKLIEAGEDFSSLVTQFRTDASRYLDSKLDPNLPKNQLKDKSGNFDYMIIRTTALLAAVFMIRATDPTSEMAAAMMEEAEGNIDALNNGKAALSHQNTSDASKGVIRDVTYTGTVRPVDTRGHYSGTYDLMKVKITTGGAIGAAKYSVWVKDGDKLGMNEGNQVVTDEIINGDYQALAGGLQVRFAGTDFNSLATANDTWEVEVMGWSEEVDANSLQPIRMTRRWQ